MILNGLEGKPLPVYGKGENVRDWLFVDDHCEAIWAVMNQGKVGETYNVGGNSELQNLTVVQTICRMLAEETGRDEVEFTKLIAYVADRPGHDLRYAIDARKIRRECGWEPKQSFESGLRQTIRWYMDNPKWVEGVRTGAYQNWIEHNYGKRKSTDRYGKIVT